MGSNGAKYYDYVGGLVYENDQLEFIPTAEGRVLPPGRASTTVTTGSSTSVIASNRFYRYEYHLKDHLGNLRVACRCGERQTETSPGDSYEPLVVQEQHYDPFGLQLTALSGVKASIPVNRFNFNGKEDEADLGWIDFKWRHYDPSLARFFNVDRLAEKFTYMTPYQFASNNPVNKIELDGLEGVPAWWRTTTFAVRHPLIAATVGSVAPGADNLSTNVVRFSTRGSSSSSRGSVLQETRAQGNEGSQVNGFRHTLWQASITSEFGADIATQIGNAHEENPSAIDGMTNTQLTNKNFTTLAEADESVDLANNRTGRSIGEANRGLSLQSMAQKVLEVAKESGVWTASRQKNGTWKMSMNKITKDQFNQLMSVFQQLNNSGRTASEQEKHEEPERIHSGQIVK